MWTGIELGGRAGRASDSTRRRQGPTAPAAAAAAGGTRPCLPCESLFLSHAAPCCLPACIAVHLTAMAAWTLLLLLVLVAQRADADGTWLDTLMDGTLMDGNTSDSGPVVGNLVDTVVETVGGNPTTWFTGALLLAPSVYARLRFHNA